MDKGLVVELTPEGRGQVVTHALYRPRELDELRARYQGAASVHPAASDSVSAPLDKPAVASRARSDASSLPEESVAALSELCGSHRTSPRK